MLDMSRARAQTVDHCGGPPHGCGELSETTVILPLGGLASTDPAKVQAPLIRPFWLLAGMVGVAAVVLVWLRLLLR